MARTAEEIAALVEEAIKIDKEIVSQLVAQDGTDPNDPTVTPQVEGVTESDIFPYGNTGAAATADQALAASERLSRIVSSLIGEEASGSSVPTSYDYGTYFQQIVNELQDIQGELQDIEAQLTPITPEAQGEVFADQLARIRYLADPEANEADGDNRQGTGVRTTPPFNELYLAYLWKELSQGKMVDNYNDTITDENIQEYLDKINNHDNDTAIQQQITIMKAWIQNIQDNF